MPPGRLSSHAPSNPPPGLNRRAALVSSSTSTLDTPLLGTPDGMWETPASKLLVRDFTDGQVVRACTRLFLGVNWLFWILEGPGSIPLFGEWQEFPSIVYREVDSYEETIRCGGVFVPDQHTRFLLHVMIYFLVDWNTERAERMTKALLTEGDFNEFLEETCVLMYGIAYSRMSSLSGFL